MQHALRQAGLDQQLHRCRSHPRHRGEVKMLGVPPPRERGGVEDEDERAKRRERRCERSLRRRGEIGPPYQTFVRSFDLRFREALE